MKVDVQSGFEILSSSQAKRHVALLLQRAGFDRIPALWRY